MFQIELHEEKVNFENLIFDLDGVLTDTALVHLACWKYAFENFVESLGVTNYKFLNEHYDEFLDGKTRIEGATSYLTYLAENILSGFLLENELRSIAQKICDKKNSAFRASATGNLKFFSDAKNFLESARACSVPMCVYTSSKNGLFILNELGWEFYFLQILSGSDLEEAGLKSKPSRDGYSFLITQNKFEPSKTVVFEDAVSGVRAGADSGAITIGISRKQDANEPRNLKAAGALHVVSSFEEITLNAIDTQTPQAY